MGVEIKLTDRELPISPVVIEFLSAYVHGRAHDAQWHDQVSEALVPAEPQKRIEYAQSVADEIMEHPLGRRAIYRAYELFAAIATGAMGKLKPLHDRYRFICVVGCPRHGGTYLTKELFRAVGLDPETVPNAIAHDGFPDLAPFALGDRLNVHVAMTQQIAEYLAMVEVYFENGRREADRIVVPKKATKAAYHGAFFGAVLGPATEFIVTLRHPIAACVSTYEKSTGLPADGRFAARGNIEGWARRDSQFLGLDDKALDAAEYFDVYLRYWENYHYNLALTGLGGNRNWRVVAYGADRLAGLARQLRARFGSAAAVEAFSVSDVRERHRAWRPRAESALRRVAAVWNTAGLDFPLDELMEGW